MNAATVAILAIVIYIKVYHEITEAGQIVAVIFQI